MDKVNVVRRDKRVKKLTREERLENPYAGMEARWTVEVLIYEQEMWEPLEHAARFKTQAEAERLAERVRKAMDEAYDYYRKTGKPLEGKFGGLDLKYWIWHPSPACPFIALQEKPTAEPYDA